MSVVLTWWPNALPAGLDLGRDLPIALGVLLLLVLILMLIRRRRRHRGRVKDGADAAGGAGPVPARTANVRRSTREPLFADPEAEADPLAAGLRAATGPMEVLDVLQRAGTPEPEPPPAPVGGPPEPNDPTGPDEPAAPQPVPATVRPAPVLPREVPPSAWLLAGGVAALLLARRRRRGER